MISFLFFFVAKSLVDIVHRILHNLVHADERSNCNNCKQRDCDSDTWHYYFYFFTNKPSSILSIIILKLNEITFGFFIHTAILGCLNTWRVHAWTHFLFWCVTQFIHILQEVFVRLETSTSVLVGEICLKLRSHFLFLNECDVIKNPNITRPTWGTWGRAKEV